MVDWLGGLTPNSDSLQSRTLWSLPSNIGIDPVNLLLNQVRNECKLSQCQTWPILCPLWYSQHYSQVQCNKGEPQKQKLPCLWLPYHVPTISWGNPVIIYYLYHYCDTVCLYSTIVIIFRNMYIYMYIYIQCILWIPWPNLDTCIYSCSAGYSIYNVYIL